MRIVIIGAGRLASCLAPALRRGGAVVAQVWSRSEASARALAASVGCDAAWGQLEAVLPGADVYLICVRDDAIADVARRLRAVVGSHGVLAHTSGSTSLADIAVTPADAAGVFYPLQSFTRGRDIDFSQVHFFIEATTADAAHRLEALAAAVARPDHVHRLATPERRRMHLAAVFVSNFVNHCCALADDILRPTGVGFDVMRPLLAATVAKLQHLTPGVAQTGPALRWDEGVLAAHSALLADAPLTQHIYALLSESIHTHHETSSQ